MQDKVREFQSVSRNGPSGEAVLTILLKKRWCHDDVRIQIAVLATPCHDEHCVILSRKPKTLFLTVPIARNASPIPCQSCRFVPEMIESKNAIANASQHSLCCSRVINQTFVSLWSFMSCAVCGLSEVPSPSPLIAFAPTSGMRHRLGRHRS